MSFLKNLTKGFIRSAVNQVGRDGGRVISNKVYKGKHATPIKSTSNESTYHDGTVQTEIGTFPYQVKGIGLSFIAEMVGAFIISLIYPPYTPLVIILYAVGTFFNPMVEAYVYTNSRRVLMDIKGTEIDRISNRVRGGVIFIIAVFCWYLRVEGDTPEDVKTQNTEIINDSIPTKENNIKPNGNP